MKILHKRLLLLSTVLFLLFVNPSCSRLGDHFPRADEGGSFLVIAVKVDPAQVDQAVAQTIAVLEKRCDEMDIRCKTERLTGDKANQIKISYPAIKDPERVKSILLSEGLELRAVVSPPVPAPVQTYPSHELAAAAAGTEKEVLPYLELIGNKPGDPLQFVVVERTPIVTGQDVRDASVVDRRGGKNDYQVHFQLTPAAGERFGAWTSANINNNIGVVFNKKVRSIAYIKSQITDTGEISGRFTKAEAEDAVMVLKSGSLPAPIEAVEEGIDKP